MGLLSFRNKKKQEGAHAEPAFKSRQDDAPPAARGRGKERKERAERKDHGNEPADSVLPEKKRARRRLLGAVALVVAVVIGLPMVLDSEPKPLADDIAIRIPSKDKAGTTTEYESVPVPVKAPASAPAARAPVAASLASSLDPKEDIVETAKSAQHAQPADAKVDSKTPSPVKPAAAAPAENLTPASDEPKPVDSKQVEPKPPAPAPNKPVANALPAVDNSAQAKQEAAAEARKAEAKKAEARKAELKKAELKKAEAKAEAKAKADAKAAELKAAALKQANEIKAAALKQANEAKVEKVVVQVAALATTEKINEVLAKLKSAGIQSYSQKVMTDAGERTRIRIITPSKVDAEKMRARLASIGLGGAAVVPAN